MKVSQGRHGQEEVGRSRLGGDAKADDARSSHGGK